MNEVNANRVGPVVQQTTLSAPPQLEQQQQPAAASKQGVLDSTGATSTEVTNTIATNQAAVTKSTSNTKADAPVGETVRQQVNDAVTRLNDYVQSTKRDLRFNLDKESGKTIITIVDSKTSEVIRQIPDEVALRLARTLQQNEPLSLFNAKA
jgi:flagellar protein FlaG